MSLEPNRITLLSSLFVNSKKLPVGSGKLYVLTLSVCSKSMLDKFPVVSIPLINSFSVCIPSSSTVRLSPTTIALVTSEPITLFNPFTSTSPFNRFLDSLFFLMISLTGLNVSGRVGRTGRTGLIGLLGFIGIDGPIANGVNSISSSILINSTSVNFLSLAS